MVNAFVRPSQGICIIFLGCVLRGVFYSYVLLDFLSVKTTGDRIDFPFASFIRRDILFVSADFSLGYSCKLALKFFKKIEKNM